MTPQPTDFQLALALTLVKAKPLSLTSREYIHQLRACIIPAKRPQFSATYEESQQNYINAAFHFRTLLSECEAKEEDFRNQLAEKEKEIERLRFRVIDAEGRSANRKRIDRGEDQVSEIELNGLKRKRTEKGSGATEPEVDVGKELGRLWPSRSKAGESLLRHVYQLQKALSRGNVDTDRSNLKSTIRETCRHTTLALADFLAENNTSGLSQRLPERATFFRALTRIIKMACAGFTLVVEGEHQDGHTTNVLVYEILTLFKTLLGNLTDATRHWVQCTGPQRPRDATTTDSGVCSSIVALLTTLASFAMSPTFHASPIQTRSSGRATPAADRLATRRALLDGTLYILLTRAGTLLYILTFHEPAAGDSTGPICTSLPIAAQRTGTASSYTRRKSPLMRPRLRQQTNGTENNAEAELDLETALEVEAASIEAEHLTPLLRLLLPGFVHETFHLDGGDDWSADRASSKSTSIGEPKSYASSTLDSYANAQSHPITEATILGHPLAKLQNTLLAGCFVAEDFGGDVLSLPVGMSVADAEGDLEGDEERGGDFDFACEMWCRVGWDVLARDL